MLIGLVLISSISPVLAITKTDAARIALVVGHGLALCLGAWSFASQRKIFIVAVGIIGLALTFAIMGVLTGSPLAIFLTFGSMIVFWVMCAWLVGRNVLRPGPANLNRIAGGVCIYMIAANVWALTYTLLHLSIPTSFKGLEYAALEGRLAEFLYFSYITLTTLGYGDVTPVHPLARWLAQFEAVFGQFYIAILIATLVGTWIASATSGESGNGGR